MICLRDNRFDIYARKLERKDFFSAVPVEYDGLEQQHITKNVAHVWEIFKRYNGSTFSDLQKFSSGKLITLGHIKNEDLAFFTISNIEFDGDAKEIPSRFALNTSNLMGVLRLRHPDNETSIQMEIHSRFDKDNRQLFLNYLLSKVFQVDFMDLVSAGSNRLWDILVAIMFIQRLKEAVPIGLYKEYKQFEKNDLNFRGRLDLPRHLRQNFPLNDKIAYSYREITFDNPLNHLLRSALEMIRKKWPSLLYNDPDIRDLITALTCATPTWNHSSIRDILRMPICKEALRHPFFAEYYEESRVLAVMILQEEGLSVYDAAESEVSGVVFDGAWLWEEYISTILSPLGFLHANYDTKVGKIKLFNEAGIVGMDDIYPDFYSEARKIVLDTKYKNDKESREDIFQLLSYTFITGAEKCGLIYPPQENNRIHSNVTINQKSNSNKAEWHSFAFDAILENKDIIAFMQEQENRLAKYIEIMEKKMLYNIYFSPTGGTKKVADILVGNLGGACRAIDLCREIESLALQAEDVCLVSVPSFAGRVPQIAVERIKKIAGNGAKAVLNCVYGNREWDDTLTELQDTLEACGFVCVAAVAAVAEHSIFRQFAAGRPDKDDANELAEFAHQITTKLNGGVFSKLELAGSHGTYKELANIPFKPEANDACDNCGICAAGCPVGAIDKADPRQTDTDRCISCMRCRDICPKHARDLDPVFMQDAAEKMAPKLGGHKKNYLFL